MGNLVQTIRIHRAKQGSYRYDRVPGNNMSRVPVEVGLAPVDELFGNTI
jgi:hypothetical protein